MPIEDTYFPTQYDEILERIEQISPVKYGSTRNFIDGAVTKLSPYISRGIISTRIVFEKVLERGYALSEIQKFIQELAWRDYWQQVWISKGNQINGDLKKPQQDVSATGMPDALSNACCGITAVDKAIEEFYTHGYLHNHLRMYIASIACNIAKCHWFIPAKWMYFHLLDGDWASNALSWQWVAGSNSNKKYIANQENINKYCYTNQKNTFLDISYEELSKIDRPEELKSVSSPALETPLPPFELPKINNNLPTLIYNYYNMDPLWMKDVEANRILLLEPSIFKKYPISEKCLTFLLALGKNIPDLQVYVGEFQDLKNDYMLTDIHFKEHPLNNYQGKETSRDWMFEVTGYYPSFFAFWKKCMKTL